MENPGQQPQRHHMALRSQVSVGGGRSSDNNKDTNKANTAALSRQSSAALDTRMPVDTKVAVLVPAALILRPLPVAQNYRALGLFPLLNLH